LIPVLCRVEEYTGGDMVFVGLINDEVLGAGLRFMVNDFWQVFAWGL